MEIRDNREAIEAAKSLEGYLKQRLETAKSQLSALESQAARWKDVISRLEKGIAALEKVGDIWTSNQFGQISLAIASAPSENLKAIVKILENAGTRLRAKQIAEQAEKEGSISSSTGSGGVEGKVRQTLSRNEQVFENVGWGWWDLRSRRSQRQPKAEPPPMEAESSRPGVVLTPKAATLGAAATIKVSPR